MNELTTTFRIESPPAWLEIGYDAENNWRTITINCEYWFNIESNGTVVLMFKPSCSKPAYPLKVERDGNNIVWTPESAELVAGVGTMQAFFEVDGTTIGASKKIPCEVDGSLLGSASGGTPPWAIDVIEEIKTLTGHYPYVSDGKLYVWDAMTEQWIEFTSTGGGAVDSVNGKTGAVVLDADDVGAYVKPSTGIPKIDLAAAVQTSLGKADTALQEHQSLAGYATESYVQQQIATIPSVTVDSALSDTSENPVQNKVITAAVGQMATYIDNLSTNKADRSELTPLPTVTTTDNGKSLVVENGAWGKGYQAERTPRVAMASTDTTPTIDPNKLYVFPEMASLAPTLATPTDNTIVNEYHFVFDSGATATVLTLPASVLQPDGFTVEANHVYEISILENCMTAQGWAVSA